MKQMKFRWFFPILILLAPSAFAADTTLFGREGDSYGPKPGSLTFTMYGGNYLNGLGQDLITAHDRQTKIWDTGLRAGWAFNKFVETDLSFGFARTRLTADTENVYLFSANVTGQYPVFADRLVPYLTFGAGSVFFDPKRTQGDTDFAINYGGGLKYFIFKNLALAADARGLTSFQETHTALLLSYGLIYYFQFRGERPAPKVLEPVAPSPAPPPPPQVTPAPTPQPTAMPTAGPTPLPTPVSELDQFGGVIEGVTFETGKYIIRKDSYTTLNLAAGFFVKHPELKLRVGGYTDNTGSDAFNQKLSTRRAEAVRQYLLKQGVRKERMEAAGYGSSRPIATNDTPEGRSKNRRIEFKILNPEAFNAP
ncbi:MAG: OmpA family protein [Pseudomonadota bacterium]